MQWAEDSLFDKCCWENWTDTTCRKMKVDHLFIVHTRTNSKWIKNLNARIVTIKIIEENIGSKISDISYSNIFSDTSPQARETEEKNKQMGLKSFCTAKENNNKMKRQPQNGRTYLPIHLISGQYSTFIKNL